MTTSFADQLLMYPVPARFVPDVTRLLTELTEGQVPDAKVSDAIVASLGGTLSSSQDDWTETELLKLLPLLSPQNKVALAVLDLAAENPNALVPYPDACARAGVDTSKGKAGIGALTKVCHKIGKDKWPVSKHWAEGGENFSYYRMTKITAERWQRVRAVRP